MATSPSNHWNSKNLSIQGKKQEMTFSPTKWLNHPLLKQQHKLLKQGGNWSMECLPTSAQSFFLASFIADFHSPTLVIAESIKKVNELAIGLECWGSPYIVFPEIEPVSTESLPDPLLMAERLRAAYSLLNFFSGTILTTELALEEPLPSPSLLQEKRFLIVPGKTTDRSALIERLVEAGYERVDTVDNRGQFAVRGSIVDFFSWDGLFPLRTEWEGNQIISLRQFHPITQRSFKPLDEAFLSLINAEDISKGKASLYDYLPKMTPTFWSKAPEIAMPDIDIHFESHILLDAPKGDWFHQERRWEFFLSQLTQWIEKKWEIVIFVNNEGEESRLKEILSNQGINIESIFFAKSPLLKGFSWPAAKLAILTDAEIFGRYQNQKICLRNQETNDALEKYLTGEISEQWKEGDYVVHLQHGICRFRGIKSMDGTNSEMIELEFDQKAKLYVPIDQANLISRYIGGTKKQPKLDSLGGTRWLRAKSATEKAVSDLAERMLKINAEREVLEGFAFPKDDHWQREFEESFIYEETADQLKAIEETKRDMESKRPMDRLICGDVGFGKTEVAIRAIFKAVMGGKQAALLAPTTVLAKQHFNTLSERFADYPIRTALLCRLIKNSEEKEILTGLKNGSIDVVIGTHRLLSADVAFKDLGLIVIDEEQRFGVLQKEKWKETFRLIDVLSLSATPIPRTLYLALAGARDMSLIETPPPNRYPIETIVSAYDERIIRQAIERELNRGGQVYFLHNRIRTIEKVASRIKSLLPSVKIAIGHGRMKKSELEEVMESFVNGQIDVLLATSIIENGLDIPNANTIIIDRADLFGLADLYQLRGRVGRSNQKAYAYLLLPRDLFIQADAKKRIKAMQEHSQLGVGFQIALRDLEIRGAGNLLGTSQSGHIASVGFELYCKLLKKAVQRLQGKEIDSLTDCKVSLDFLLPEPGGGRHALAFIPFTYMERREERLQAYRQLAEALSLGELEEIKKGWKDRFGAWPEPVENLFSITEIRLMGAAKGIERVESDQDKLKLMRHREYLFTAQGKFPRLIESDTKTKIMQIKKWLEAF
ncbi:transcription-repair coupling factor [Methylacidiphilum kamchatkense Kam1]|uniref:Transcription-repair-coupling factor n=2 Tax=Methylacidiphilum kamchatkense Kam1 TaxID=1202785 RepID=A0ABR4ZXQ6_9BACT|nr:transcription-repair coupling factor [Methylacidiphilum kamchatkense]KIE59025.1 transcription-repair coupling factor [Methylacidiphilum kamchatkense Kam1]